MQVPFPELTYLELLPFFDGEVPFTPDSFLGGSAPRLQYLSLSSIPLPRSPKLLLSAKHLDELALRHIPHSRYISPEAVVDLISISTSLKTFHLGFQSPESRPPWESRSLPPPKRSILPALKELHFRGVTEYLEELMTRIDTLQLDRIRITFFNQIDFDCPRLTQFINRTPTLTGRALDEAHV